MKTGPTHPAKRRRHWRRWLVLFVVLAAAASLSEYLGERAVDEAMAGWQSQWEPALEAARRSDRPVLVYFTADWCAACRMFSRSVLADPGVMTAIERSVVPVVASLDGNSGWAHDRARDWGIQSIPTIVLATPEGEPASAYYGGMQAERFASWVEAGLGSGAEEELDPAATGSAQPLPGSDDLSAGP